MFGHRTFLRIGELPDASIMGLIKDGHELLSCSYSFQQGVDHKGEAQTSVRGGSLHLVIDGFPTEELIEWGLNSRRYKSGAIVLCDSNDMPLEKVYFSEAACVNFKIHYNSSGNDSYIKTRMVLQAQTLKIDDIDFQVIKN